MPIDGPADGSNAPGSRREPGPGLVVGLTGGIGSGKSTAAWCFAQLGVPVIEADTLAREIVAPGQPALDAIVTAFGDELLTPEGSLDRRRLRERVFGDARQRERLEAILHPRIRREMQRRLRELDAPYCVLCIPLLLEAGQRDLVDRVLVVDAPPERQIERVQARDGTSRESIERIMRTQWSRSNRLAAADDVIRNEAGLEELRARVASLHEQYLRMSGHHLPPPHKS